MKDKKSKDSNSNNVHIRYYEQKRILHKYVRWMYQLLADGRYYELPQSKKIKDLPKEGTYSVVDIPFYRRSDELHHKKYYYDDFDLVNADQEEKEYYGRKVRLFERIYHCHDTIFGSYDKTNKKVLIRGALSCSNRICPVCEVKKAIREYSKLMYSIDTFGDKYDYYMLTVTLPNNNEGFKDELNLFKSCLAELLRFVGFNGAEIYNVCEGAYGSYEITHKDKGWHPHLHIMLAYPKENVKSYKAHTWYDIKRHKTVSYVDEFMADNGHSKINFNYDQLVERWVQLVERRTDKYDEILKLNRWLDINFVKIDSTADGVNEMAKYLIDFRQIENADELYIFMRDSYGTKQRVRRGCFIWSPEVNEAYSSFIDERRKEVNKDFVQSGEVVDCVISWKFNEELGRKIYHLCYKDKILEQVPWTDRFEVKEIDCIVKLE